MKILETQWIPGTAGARGGSPSQLARAGGEVMTSPLKGRGHDLAPPARGEVMTSPLAGGARSRPHPLCWGGPWGGRKTTTVFRMTPGVHWGWLGAHPHILGNQQKSVEK